MTSGDRRRRALGARMFVVGLFATGLLVLARSTRPTGESALNATSADSHAEASSAVALQYVPRFDPAATRVGLERAGWSGAAAEAVVRLNTPFFAILRQDDPPAWENALARLRQLGAHPELMGLLARRPEVAGLLAGAIDPVAVAAPLHDSRNYDVLAALYGRHAADPDALAGALRQHSGVIIRLSEAGWPGTEAVFLYPRRGNAATEYGRWLDDLLGGALRRSDEDVEAALGVVLSQGQAVRRRMEDDATFRRRFTDDIWPRFERLVDRGHLTWEQAAIDSHLFDLLALPEGEALIEKWGPLPGYLLLGPDRYPTPLHPRIIAAMQSGDNDTLEALMRFGRLAQFRELLDREGLSGDTLAAALNRLQGVPEVNAPAELAYFASLSDSALEDEVGPPPSGPVTWLPLYDTYQVAKTLSQGRTVSTSEWAFAVSDPATMLFGLAKGGAKGTKTLVTTLRNGAKREAAKQVGQQATQLGEKELAPWMFSHTLARVRQQTTKSLEQSLTVEITGPVRYFFQATGVGRKTFKQFTNLEARLFMRGDAKVLVRVDRLGGRPLIKTFLEATTEAAFERTAKGSPYEGELRVAWQANTSAWWLLNAVRHD